jgi:hypothetical protein
MNLRMPSVGHKGNQWQFHWEIQGNEIWQQAEVSMDIHSTTKAVTIPLWNRAWSNTITEEQEEHYHLTLLGYNPTLGTT